MGRASATALDPRIREMAVMGDLRVWSVIVTIFGDAVLPRGGLVPARAVTALAARLGIRAEAVRVALHRLARDGWIERTRAGRHAFYGLSASGRARFLPASRRIYAPAPALSEPWRLAVLPAGGAGAAVLERAGWLALNGGCWLGPAEAGAAPREAVVAERLAAMPDWARTALAGAPLQADYARLERALRRVSASLDTASLPEAEVAAALRILIVHHWRRLLLRHPDVPAELLPEGWRGEACRAHVLKLHAALSAVADAWLDEAIGPRVGRGS
ncbi:MAG: PaaX family transcriptional regulator C-terminal domain-containing protein [Rhodobacter sp.]|nr:PaaX family transcriptional regulator C-terminal domain-containing protein [Rhodobacter sp.]